MGATAVSVVSLVIAGKYRPWLRDSDSVAECASYVLFAWVFALLAYDGLLSVHPLIWGTPLVGSAIYLIFYAARLCYVDVLAFEQEIERESENTEGGCGGSRRGEDEDAD